MRRLPPASPLQAATAAVEVFGGTTVELVLSPHRGSASDALARRHAIWLWHKRFGGTYLQAGQAFDRDRTTASDAVRHVEAHTSPRVRRLLRQALSRAEGR